MINVANGNACLNEEFLTESVIWDSKSASSSFDEWPDTARMAVHAEPIANSGRMIAASSSPTAHWSDARPAGWRA